MTENWIFGGWEVLPRSTACVILVPRPAAEAGPQRWKRQVLTTGLPGNSLKTEFFNLINFNFKTQFCYWKTFKYVWNNIGMWIYFFNWKFSNIFIEIIHIHKNHPFKVYKSMTFSISRVVQPSPQSKFRTFSSSQKETPYPLAITPISWQPTQP